jgi:hypothetical protein
MPSNDNWFLPTCDQPRNVSTDDSFPEHSTAKNIPDCAIWGLPHLLQVEFYE